MRTQRSDRRSRRRLSVHVESGLPRFEEASIDTGQFAREDYITCNLHQLSCLAAFVNELDNPCNVVDNVFAKILLID